jgi:hypothetical protein
MGYYESSNLIYAYEFFTHGTGIVTLCGSTKFFTECMEINKRLTFDGWIVLQCGFWGHSYHKYSEGNKSLNISTVKNLHFCKILKSDAIVVVYDKSQYVGSSTIAEITFSKHHGIPVFYFDGEFLTGSTNKKTVDRLTSYASQLKTYTEETKNSLGY